MLDHQLMLEMIRTFKTHYKDWMGFEIRKNNPLTYHHIIKKEDDGEETFDNGALLTKKGHYLLHRAERYDKKLYDEYNYWFKLINDMKSPLTEEMQNIMKALRKRLNAVKSKSQIKNL